MCLSLDVRQCVCLSFDCASVYVFVFRLCISVCVCLLIVRQCMCLSLDCASLYVFVFRLCVSVCVCL